jgi:hypothetical protein
MAVSSDGPGGASIPDKAPVPVSWALSRNEGRIGTGNWQSFPHERVGDVFEAAAHWKRGLEGIDRPWLCWCVDDEWCQVQQRLVAAAGWTPIVGTDGRVARPSVTRTARFLDFNAHLRLPVMWMHFPLEFAFLFAERLAFWHSDVLPPVAVMRRVAGEFEALQDGDLGGVKIDRVGWGWRLRRILQGKPPFYRRWYEVLGCTTAGASRSQFEHGCGWWRHPECHPHAGEVVKRRRHHWEHGVGIAVWEELFGGRAVRLATDVEAHHYSAASSSSRHRLRQAVADKQAELRAGFDLAAIVRSLGLEDGV